MRSHNGVSVRHARGEGRGATAVQQSSRGRQRGSTACVAQRIVVCSIRHHVVGLITDIYLLHHSQRRHCRQAGRQQEARCSTKDLGDAPLAQSNLGLSEL